MKQSKIVKKIHSFVQNKEQQKIAEIENALKAAGAKFTDKEINFIATKIREAAWQPTAQDCVEFLNECNTQGPILTMREYQLISAEEFSDLTGMEESDWY